MILIALITASWIPAVLGFGALLHYQGFSGLRRAVSGLLGLGVLSVLGICLHFVVALSPAVSAVVWLAGSVLAWRRRAWLLEGLTRWEAAGAAAALVALLMLMQTPAQHYDAGLYYLQAVRWIAERPVEIGLVNLHFRLALGDTWFVLSALLEHPLAIGASSYVANLLPMLFASAGAFGALGRLVAGDRSFPTVALALVLPPLGFATIGLGAPQADRVLTFLIPFTLALWARALEAGQPFTAEARAASLLSLFAALLKVSAFPLAAGGVLVLALHRRALDRRFRVGLLGLAALAVVPWLVRSVLHSGCLVFPAAGTCFTGLRWTPEAAAVRNIADWVSSWARQPGLEPAKVLGSWAWFLPWTAAQLSSPDTRAMALLLAAGLLAGLAGWRGTPRALVLPWAISIAGAAAWFLSAPDPRFGAGFLFAVGLLPLAHAASRARWLAGHGARRAAALAVVAGAVFFVHANELLWITWLDGPALALVTPPALPVPGVEERVTRSGYRVNVPARGELCWAAAIPCTPYFDPELGRDWALVPSGQLAPTASPR